VEGKSGTHDKVERHDVGLETMGLLVAEIGHDFNNLLATIVGNIDLAGLDLEGGMATPATQEARRLLGEAKKASLRATGLTRQLLAIGAGAEPVRESVDVEGLIREVASIHEKTFGAGVAFRLELQAGIAPVQADGSQIFQLLQNLVLNAGQAMPRGGEIRIGLRDSPSPRGADHGHRDGWILIEVADSGPGIPVELREKIFEPYWTTKDGGRGLGLAVCHAVVRKHGGTIAVDEAPGGGALFSVRLPLDEGAVSSTAP